MDTTGRLGRHSSKGIAAGWSQIHLQPTGDELLSTYLVRLAHRRGLSPHRFTTRCLPGVAIWTRDIDTSLSSETRVLLAQHLEISELAVRSMTLYGLMGFTSPIDEEWRYCRRWINAVGIYHRIRTRYGLQYCPLCLKAQPVFRRQWRLAFSFVCAEHGAVLQDCCLSCGVPVMPHRCKFDVTRCWRCGASLCTCALGDELAADILPLQARLMGWADSEFIPVGAELVPRAQFVHGAASVLRMMKEHMHSHPNLWTFGATTVAIHDELRLLRTPARLCLFSMLTEILDEWPVNFLQFALVAGITQVAFGRYDKVPPWLATVVSQLPIRLRSRDSFSEANLLRYIRRLEHEGGTKNRSLRAQALMQAARGKNGR